MDFPAERQSIRKPPSCDFNALFVPVVPLRAVYCLVRPQGRWLVTLGVGRCTPPSPPVRIFLAFNAPSVTSKSSVETDLSCSTIPRGPRFSRSHPCLCDPIHRLCKCWGSRTCHGFGCIRLLAASLLGSLHQRSLLYSLVKAHE